MEDVTETSGSERGLAHVCPILILEYCCNIPQVHQGFSLFEVQNLSFQIKCKNVSDTPRVAVI